MGVQTTLRDIMSGFLTATAHTANFKDVEEALNKALDRTGTVDNALEVDLDYGNNRGINLDDGVLDSDAATVRQIRNAVADSITSGGATAAVIQAAIDVAVANALAAAGTGFVVQRVEYLTGFTDGATVVTLPTVTYVPGVNNVIVIRNGLTLTSGVDFTEDSTSQITVTPPLVSDDRLIIRVNDTTTNSVSNTGAISHTSGGNTTTLATFLDAIEALIASSETTSGVTHTDADGTSDLDDYLVAQKAALASVTTASANLWEDENGSTDNAMFMTGAVIPFAINGTKAGWLECDGSAVSRTTYSRLFGEIGVTYGAGDSSTTFNLPDLRGEFVRGWDNGAGVDSGRVIATNQGQSLQSHTHTLGVEVGTSRGSPDNPLGAVFDAVNGDTASKATGGAETRPRNVAMPYYIKT